MALVGGFILHPIILPCSDPIMDTDTIYVHSVSYDTIIQEKPVPVDVIKYVPEYTTIYQPVTVPVDTTAIIREYFSVRYYDDILKDDSTGYLRLKEKVYQSEIIDREVFFQSRCTDKIITNTIYPSGLYFEGSLSLSKQLFIPSVGVTYLGKNKALYRIGCGYYKSPVLTVGYGIKF